MERSKKVFKNSKVFMSYKKKIVVRLKKLYVESILKEGCQGGAIKLSGLKLKSFL